MTRAQIIYDHTTNMVRGYSEWIPDSFPPVPETEKYIFSIFLKMFKFNDRSMERFRLVNLKIPGLNPRLTYWRCIQFPDEGVAP